MDDTLASWLNTKLKERGWSQREAARRAGISRTPLSGILSEQYDPDLKVLIALADVFDTPREDVLRLAGMLPPTPPAVQHETQALNLFRRIPQHLRQAALTILDTLTGTPRLPAQNALNESSARYQLEARKDLGDRVADEIVHGLQTMPLDDQQALLDFMNKLKDKCGNGGTETNIVPMEPA